MEDNTVTLTILVLYYIYTCIYTYTTTKILLYYVHTFTTVQINSPTGSQRSNQHNTCIILHAPIQPRFFSGSCGQASMGRTLTLYTYIFLLSHIHIHDIVHAPYNTYILESPSLPSLITHTHTHFAWLCIRVFPLLSLHLSHTHTHMCTLPVSLLSHIHVHTYAL